MYYRNRRSAIGPKAKAPPKGVEMTGAIIGFVLSNLPAILLVFAILAGTLSSHRPRSEALLSWLLLLPIGIAGIWAAVYHLLFPKFAAAFIGWQPSPFQFEVGVADLAYGVTACVAFWRSRPFKAAVTCISSIALLGDAVGHIRQMRIAGNFAPGNAGLIFYCDILIPLAAITTLILAQRKRDAGI
jgi:hypothetical protein